MRQAPPHSDRKTWSWVFVCACACVCACESERIVPHIWMRTMGLPLQCVHTYIYIYIDKNVCAYVRIYIYIHTYVYVTQSKRWCSKQPRRRDELIWHVCESMCGRECIHGCVCARKSVCKTYQTQCSNRPRGQGRRFWKHSFWPWSRLIVRGTEKWQEELRQVLWERERDGLPICSICFAFMLYMFCVQYMLWMCV